MTLEQTKACLELFNGFNIKTFSETYYVPYAEKQEETKVERQLLEKGIVLVPKDYCKYLSEDEIQLILDMYGITGEEFNKTLHKSFVKVKDSNEKVLVIEQLLHYMSAYGYESLFGEENPDVVYIPTEELDVPELDVDKIELKVIYSLDEETIKTRLLKLITSGVALSKKTVNNIITLSDYIDKENFNKVNNREIKIALYDKYNIVPSNPDEWLRYVLYKLTGQTLKIKDKETINLLQCSDEEDRLKLLKQYKDQYGLEKLATIYNRNKELFLAMKHKFSLFNENPKYKEINTIINRISKLAKKYHVPQKPDILDGITNMTYEEYKNNEEKINKLLYYKDMSRVVRVLNSLSYRMSAKCDDPIVYKIRNGKAYTDKIKVTDKQKEDMSKIYNDIYHECLLNNKLKETLKDKIVYIPDNIEYVVPQSEKQYIGDIPEGSYINLEREDNLLVGICWNNLEGDVETKRVDLDLKMQNTDMAIGWDANYRDNEKCIYFSGDVTDAANGATEVIWVGSNVEKTSFLLTMNVFTANKLPIPYKLVIAKTKDTDICNNYVIDPNNIIYQIDMETTPGQNRYTLGLVKIEDSKVQFNFKTLQLGSDIVTRSSEVITDTYTYLDKYSKTQLTLRQVLDDLGVKIINEPEIEEFKITRYDPTDGEPLYQKVIVKPDYDLSLNSISKDTLIALLSYVDKDINIDTEEVE